jgi:hypothetical protein
MPPTAIRVNASNAARRDGESEISGERTVPRRALCAKACSTAAFAVMVSTGA